MPEMGRLLGDSVIVYNSDGDPAEIQKIKRYGQRLDITCQWTEGEGEEAVTHTYTVKAEDGGPCELPFGFGHIRRPRPTNA